MTFWRVCPGFARFLRERSTRVQVSEDTNRMEVPRVSFAWPIWIPLKMIRSLLLKDLPTASELLVSVLGVPPAIPRLFDAVCVVIASLKSCVWRRNIYRLFGRQLANYSCHFLFAFALMPIFIGTILRDRSGFLSLLVYPRLWDIVVHPLPFLFAIFCVAFIFAIWLLAAVPCVTVSHKCRQVSLTALRSSVCRLIWQQNGTRYFFIAESIERDVETLLGHKVLRKLS